MELKVILILIYWGTALFLLRRNTKMIFYLSAIILSPLSFISLLLIEQGAIINKQSIAAILSFLMETKNFRLII